MRVCKRLLPLGGARVCVGPPLRGCVHSWRGCVCVCGWSKGVGGGRVPQPPNIRGEALVDLEIPPAMGCIKAQADGIAVRRLPFRTLVSSGSNKEGGKKAAVLLTRSVSGLSSRARVSEEDPAKQRELQEMDGRNWEALAKPARREGATAGWLATFVKPP